jgi:choline dehydrogenase-like flavoprotein
MSDLAETADVVVVGGSSAVNATVALRARAADFAEWGEHGAEGWSFDDVLPAFRLLENTPPVTTPITDGPARCCAPASAQPMS